jgi:hypothetical protein
VQVCGRTPAQWVSASTTDTRRKPETARWRHNPKTIITVKGPANIQRGALAQGPAFYCPGWLRHLLSPTPLVWHNGGTIGSKAAVAFTPDGDLGLVVLSNLDGTDMPGALMYYLYDLYYAWPTMPTWSMAGLSSSAALTAGCSCGAVYATTSSERPAPVPRGVVRADRAGHLALDGGGVRA